MTNYTNSLGVNGENGFEEEIKYLDELLDSYEELVKNIGNNGLSAFLVLSYRDEIDLLLKEIGEDKFPSNLTYKLSLLDEDLRENAKKFVSEVSSFALKEGRKGVNPGRAAWWWHLDIIAKREKEFPLYKKLLFLFKYKELLFLTKDEIIEKSKELWREFAKWLRR